MSKLFDIEAVLKAGRDAAWIARHGTREVEEGTPEA